MEPVYLIAGVYITVPGASVSQRASLRSDKLGELLGPAMPVHKPILHGLDGWMAAVAKTLRS
jgi:hypothetical protein